MFDLSLPEAILFVLVVATHSASGVVASLQLLAKHRERRSLLVPVTLAAVVSDATFLVWRGIAIKGFPLTGLFEFLVALALVFGVLYLLLHVVVDQVWFGSIFAWATLGMVVLAGFVARPASRPQTVATTPWATGHASMMILAAAAVVFATANSVLYLLGSHRLKHKEVIRVLGRIPNMETLGMMNRVSLRVGFALLTVGVLSGLGLVSSLGTGVVAWLTDGKVVCIIAAWTLLAAILVLDQLSLLRERVRAYVTIVAFALVLLGILGVTVAGVTQHQFSSCCPPVASVGVV
jgi:ABC-type uncharacterized transport system permease subunit